MKTVMNKNKKSQNQKEFKLGDWSLTSNMKLICNTKDDPVPSCHTASLFHNVLVNSMAYRIIVWHVFSRMKYKLLSKSSAMDLLCSVFSVQAAIVEPLLVKYNSRVSLPVPGDSTTFFTLGNHSIMLIVQ